jgi:4-alpha-glucanotransferase
MNFPSQLGDNWSWRMGEAALQPGLQEAIRELNQLYQR